MELIVHKQQEIKSKLDVHGMYAYTFNAIEIVHDYDLSGELERLDIWESTDIFNLQARRLKHHRGLFQDFFNDFYQLREQFFNLTISEPYFTYHWKRPKDWYLANFGFSFAFLKDLPGHTMGPHLDNRHIVSQIVINAADNPSSTELYALDSVTPIYQSSCQKNHGIMIPNYAGSIHGIRNVTADRYILYANIVLPNG